MNSVEKSNMFAVSVIVSDENGNILLHRREKDPEQGKWELFASYPRLNELPLEKAVQRILKEDAGIEKIVSINFSGKLYDTPDRHPGKVCVPLIYLVSVNQHDVRLSENIKWHTKADIKSLDMAFDNKIAVEECV